MLPVGGDPELEPLGGGVRGGDRVGDRLFQAVIVGGVDAGIRGAQSLIPVQQAGAPSTAQPSAVEVAAQRGVDDPDVRDVVAGDHPERSVRIPVVPVTDAGQQLFERLEEGKLLGSRVFVAHHASVARIRTHASAASDAVEAMWQGGTVTIVPPAPGEPRRPSGPRDPGDAWVEAPDGTRYWGRFGAAGLLAFDRARGVLLQHRVAWSHFGETWALPGGALHEGEAALDGALREAKEEAGVPDFSIRPRLTSVLDLGYWSYTTLVGDVIEPFEPTISDPESLELAWVPTDRVGDRPLHPGFASSWERLRTALNVRPVVVVDAANVVGSVPDGWWRDRVGAAERLLARVSRLASSGVSAAALELPEHTWFPEWRVVVEGRARPAGDVPDVAVVRAEASGDDAIVAEVETLARAGRNVTVATSDRALADRVRQVGAQARGAGWLLDLLSDGRPVIRR